MIRKLFALVLLGLALSCSDATGPVTGRVNIRIDNDTPTHFDNVLVGFPSGEVDYGSIPAGDVSEYRPVLEAYRYAFIRARTGSTELRIQPIDYVGEETLGPGRYTYRLYFYGEYLQLEMTRDD